MRFEFYKRRMILHVGKKAQLKRIEMWKMLDVKLGKIKKRGSDTGSRTRGSAVKGLNVTATPYRITF